MYKAVARMMREDRFLDGLKSCEYYLQQFSNIDQPILTKLNHLYDLLSHYNQDDFFPYYEHELFGFRNIHHPEITIPATYRYCYKFHKGLADVHDGHGWGKIDLAGELIMPCLYSEYSIPYEEGDQIDKNEYEFKQGRLRVKKNGLYGFVDKDFNEVVPCVYKFAYSFHETAEITPVLKTIDGKSKWGFVDLNGNEIGLFVYDYVWLFNNGMARYRKDGKFGHVNNKGVRLDKEFSYSGDFYNDFTRVTNSENKVSLINKNGDLIIPFLYDRVDSYTKDLIIVTLNNLKGVINIQGECLMPCEYDYLDIGNAGIITAKKDKHWGCYDQTGNVIVPVKYSGLAYVHEGLIWVSERVGENKKYGAFNYSGEATIPFIYDRVGIYNKKLTAMKDKQSDLYINGKIAIEDKTAPPTRNQLIKKNTSYDEINSFKNVVYKDDMEQTSIHRDGYYFGTLEYLFVPVKLNGKWGAIDQEGNEVIPCIYDGMGHFYYDIIPVEKDGKCGAIDAKGNICIPLIYDTGYIRYQEYDQFVNGFIKMRKDDQIFYLDRWGNYIIT